MSTDAATTSRQLRQLRALMAPLARNRGSVIDDERLLRLAREVCNALLHEDAKGGLLRHALARELRQTWTTCSTRASTSSASSGCFRPIRPSATSSATC